MRQLIKKLATFVYSKKLLHIKNEFYFTIKILTKFLPKITKVCTVKEEDCNLRSWIPHSLCSGMLVSAAVNTGMLIDLT